MFPLLLFPNQILSGFFCFNILGRRVLSSILSNAIFSGWRAPAFHPPLPQLLNYDVPRMEGSLSSSFSTKFCPDTTICFNISRMEGSLFSSHHRPLLPPPFFLSPPGLILGFYLPSGVLMDVCFLLSLVALALVLYWQVLSHS